MTVIMTAREGGRMGEETVRVCAPSGGVFTSLLSLGAVVGTVVVIAGILTEN